MKMNKKSLPITTICGWESRIDERPDYQRPPAWSRKQKQLLIDSILRGYDIPKMYWREVSREDFKFEVIDGQQRLRAVWEFKSDLFPLLKDADPINGYAVAGLKYSHLPLDLSSEFDIYPVDVVIVEDAVQTDDDDEVRDMFLRLQNGTTLKAQEKRNAMPGAMRNFVKELSGHAFLANCRFTNARYTFDHIAAQAVCLEVAGGPANIKDADLNRMYEENRSFDAAGPKAKKVRRVFDFLLRAFPEKTPELERYSVITLYCLASLLIDGYALDGVEEMLSAWFIEFEGERARQEKLPEEERDIQLLEYRRLISQSTDAEESVRSRLEVMERRFFSTYSDIEPRDAQRGFTHEQRLAIFRRDSGICQVRLKCDGEKVTWDHWHADHKIPHVKGGKTTVTNGQVACPACNLSKSGAMSGVVLAASR
jgi:Protein of unknown function DUF262/HNH endonuclease